MMETDKKLNKFVESVSWVKSITLIDLLSAETPIYFVETDSSLQALLVIFEGNIIQELIGFIDNWKEYCSSKPNSIFIKMPIFVCIEQELSNFHVEFVANRCIAAKGIKLVPHFLDAKSNIAWYDYLEKALDGLNWSKSLNKGQPIFEWEDSME